MRRKQGYREPLYTNQALAWSMCNGLRFIMSTNSKLLLTEKDAAAFLSISVRTIQNWRFHNTGPKYKKLGRLVRYSIVDLSAYAEGATVVPVHYKK